MVFDNHSTNAAGQSPQPVEDGIRIEAGSAVGHPFDGRNVELDFVFARQETDQGRIEARLFGDLQFVVVLAGPPGQRHCCEQDRRSELFGYPGRR